VNAQRVYGGGELVKTGQAIVFNLFSGTYSKPIIRSGCAAGRFDVRNEMVKLFNHFLPDATYDPASETTYESYIFKVTRVSNHILELYKNVGFVVRVFDTHNEHAEFHNQFWHLDFGIEYYDKRVRELKDSSELEARSCRKLQLESLSAMIELLTPGLKQTNPV
jgi:hypothetical protein